MVQSFTALLDKRLDRAGRVGGLQDFEPDIADFKKCHADFLAGDLFDVLEASPSWFS